MTMSAALVAQSWRRILYGPNPLIRRCDRTQAWVAVVLLTAGLLALPVVAAIGSHVAAGQHELMQQQQASRSPARAVLQADAPAAEPAGVGVRDSTPARVPARWAAPDGTTRTSTVEADAGAKAGDEVDIWVDRDGDRVAAPLTAVQASARGVMAALGLWAVWLGVLGMVFWLVRWWLDRLRGAEWDRAWERMDVGTA